MAERRAIDGPVLLGVDVGTQSIRVLAFSVDGRLLASASRPTPSRPWGEGVDYDPDALFATVETCLREIIAALPPGAQVVSLAVASVGETTVLVDADGRAVAPAIAWFDGRTAQAARAIEARIGPAKLFEATGHRLDPTLGLCKLWWMREHWPEAFGRGTRVLNVADWIAFRLSGVAATDFTLASRMLALDLEARRWSMDILDALGFDPRLFAPLRANGAALGPVRSDLSAALGFAKSPIVGVGGHDHLCGLFAAGAARPGVLLDSMGTAEAILRTTDAPLIDSQVNDQGFIQGAIKTNRDLFYLGGAIYSSGGAVEWLRTLFGGVPHDALIAEARAVPPGAGGAMFLPHLAFAGAPEPDDHARGALVGLNAHAKRGSLYRAALEGLSLQMRRMSDALAELPGVGKPHEIRVIGGGARNALFLSIKASVLDEPILVMDEAESTALGAAMLGGVAAGLWRDLDEAVAELERRFHVVEPQKDWVDLYEERYQKVFRTLQGQLKGPNNQIADLEARSAWGRQRFVYRRNVSNEQQKIIAGVITGGTSS
jgi:xylulokinase